MRRNPVLSKTSYPDVSWCCSETQGRTVHGSLLNDHTLLPQIGSWETRNVQKARGQDDPLVFLIRCPPYLNWAREFSNKALSLVCMKHKDTKITREGERQTVQRVCQRRKKLPSDRGKERVYATLFCCAELQVHASCIMLGLAPRPARKTGY